MKNLKLTYKNGNEIILKDVTDYTVEVNKLYYARYSFNGLVNQVVQMDNIVQIKEV